jgi:hypothetical protein
LLDALIDAGWGGVPMYVIEREAARNGGILPRRSPVYSEILGDDDQDASDAGGVDEIITAGMSYLCRATP